MHGLPWSLPWLAQSVSVERGHCQRRRLHHPMPTCVRSLALSGPGWQDGLLLEPAGPSQVALIADFEADFQNCTYHTRGCQQAAPVHSDAMCECFSAGFCMALCCFNGNIQNHQSSTRQHILQLDGLNYADALLSCTIQSKWDDSLQSCMSLTARQATSPPLPLWIH